MCLCTKFKVVLINKNRVMDQRSWRIFYYVIWENGQGASFCPPTRLSQNKCVERPSKLWTAISLAFVGIRTWNLQRYFQMGLFTLCKSFVGKVANINFWWPHCKQRILKDFAFKYLSVSPGRVRNSVWNQNQSRFLIIWRTWADLRYFCWLSGDFLDTPLVILNAFPLRG